MPLSERALELWLTEALRRRGFGVDGGSRTDAHVVVSVLDRQLVEGDERRDNIAGLAALRRARRSGAVKDLNLADLARELVDEFGEGL